MERVELIRWFAAVGEAAYPTLLALVLDPRPEVASAALAALGATGDSRLVDPLWNLPWPEAPQVDLALERARTLLRLGDWRMAPPLIDGLRDERLLTRALCAQALFEATRERFGYDPRAEEAEREEAVKRWEYWLWERVGSQS
jgi:HEAT repeat protein